MTLTRLPERVPPEPGRQRSPRTSPPSHRRPPPAPTAPSGPRSARHVWAGIAEPVAFAFLAFAVIGFSAAWSQGELLLDGPGASMWLELALDHWRAGGVPAWIPDVWAGTPVWAIAPTFPVLSLVPLAAVVGPERAIQLASVGAQVLGAWGAFVLARSLWDRWAPAVVTGVVYGLHPLLVSHAALAGNEPALGVMAATPWLVWSTLRALRGGNVRYMGLAGLIAGLAVLQQPEHAYGLVVLVACLLVVELARARTAGEAGPKPGAVVRRAGVIGVLAVGVVAYWVLPFAVLSEHFVLTPLNAVRDTLIQGVGGAIGRDPGLFLARSPGLVGNVSFDNTDFIGVGGFYLSWVCLAATFVTLMLLPRRDREGTLTAILFASAIALWMQTGGIPLASSGLAQDVNVVALAVVGGVAGLLVGSFLRRLNLGRGAVVGGILTGLFLVLLPYLTPFITLQRIVPLLASIRFPRLYPIAVLGLALATAYPLVAIGAWAARIRPKLAPLLGAAAALALMGLFLLDTHPYRSFYRVQSPPSAAAFDRAATRLANFGEADYRVISVFEPRPTANWVARGVPLSTGWPHPVASGNTWRLTAEPLFAAPREFREPAWGLSASRYTALEVVSNTQQPDAVVDEVLLARNPAAMPLVRAYAQTVVLRDADIGPELATALAPLNIGVVVGGPTESSLLEGTTGTLLGERDTCTPDALDAVPAAIAGEVAMACSYHPWVGVITGRDLSNIAAGVGGVFTAPLDNLQGVSVWLDRAAAGLRLELYELAADGLALDIQIANVGPAPQDYASEDLTSFRFEEPIADSAGKRYLFLLACGRCQTGEEPRMVRAEAERTDGTLVTGGEIKKGQVGAFTLQYGHALPFEPATTTLGFRRPGPGQWVIDADGTRPALVVVAESWFPGWRATVDGRPVPVLRADGAFLGIPVEAGQHTIALSYHEPGVATIGRLISLTTVVLIVVMVVAPQRFRWAARQRRRDRARLRREREQAEREQAERQRVERERAQAEREQVRTKNAKAGAAQAEAMSARKRKSAVPPAAGVSDARTGGSGARPRPDGPGPSGPAGAGPRRITIGHAALGTRAPARPVGRRGVEAGPEATRIDDPARSAPTGPGRRITIGRASLILKRPPSGDGPVATGGTSGPPGPETKE